MVDGASIRTNNPQGLKFTARFRGDQLDKTRGFFIAYGEIDVLDFSVLLEQNGPYVVNGKDVKLATNYNNYSMNISVVLTGIPISGYDKKVTVIGFVQEDSGEYELVPTAVTRSVAEVTLNAAKNGDHLDVLDVLTEIENNFFKHGWDEFGNYSITSSIYEYDRVQLKQQFTEDWNLFFGTNFIELDFNDFYNHASLGFDEVTNDVKNSNLFNFFYEEYSHKWSWLIDYLIEIDDSAINSRKQLSALKYQEIFNDEFEYMNGLVDSINSITNFFNKSEDVYGIDSIGFIDFEKYYLLHDYNFFVYTIPTNNSLVYKNSKLILPKPNELSHYDFEYFLDGDNNIVDPDEEYIVNSNNFLKPKYTPVKYNICFYDEELLLTSLNIIYTVEDEVILPLPEKHGYVFVGWYDNKEFDGLSLKSLESGNYGDKVFYSKWILEDNVISIVNISLDTKNYVAISLAEGYKVSLITDYNYINITIYLEENYTIGAEVSFVVNGSIIDNSKYQIIDKILKYRINDPNWTKPY